MNYKTNTPSSDVPNKGVRGVPQKNFDDMQNRRRRVHIPDEEYNTSPTTQITLRYEN